MLDKQNEDTNISYIKIRSLENSSEKEQILSSATEPNNKNSFHKATYSTSDQYSIPK